MALKFNKETEQLDRQLFYLEVERVDLIESQDTVPDELIERFIKKRSGLVKKIKDFRKSQNTKLMWNRHRFKMLKGVRKWHRSLKGKKFHRQLGRFLATRLVENTNALQIEKFETLKALSSLRTHIYIEAEYFRPTTEDDVEFELLFEYAIPFVSSLELKILESDFDNITADELETIFRLTGDEEVINSLSEMIGKSNEEILLGFKAYNVNEDLTYGMSVKYYKLLDQNEKVDSLKSLMEINEV